MYLKVLPEPRGYYTLEFFPDGWDKPKESLVFESLASVTEEIATMAALCLTQEEDFELDFHSGGPYMMDFGED